MFEYHSLLRAATDGMIPVHASHTPVRVNKETDNFCLLHKPTIYITKPSPKVGMWITVAR